MSTDLWDKSLEILRNRVDDRTFEAWLAATKFGSYHNGHLVIFVPNDFTRHWLREYYSNLLSSVVGSLANDFEQISFVPDDAPEDQDFSNMQAQEIPAQHPLDPRWSWNRV